MGWWRSRPIQRGRVLSIASFREDVVSSGPLHLRSPTGAHPLPCDVCRYDQAQLALSALEFALLPNLPAPQEENRRICEDLAADIIDYVSRNLVSADGGMFNAEDADSGESLENPGKKSGKSDRPDLWYLGDEA